MNLETVLSNLSNTNNTIKDSYWALHYQLKKYDSMVSIPLIVLSGLTSITAVTQLIGTILAIQILTIIFSILVTILAGTQKYFEFDKRASVAKQVAKRWGSVNGKITFFSLNIDSISDKTSKILLLNSIFNEMDAIGGALEDVPDLSNQKKIINEYRTIVNEAVRSL